jgi:hypothetical protein
VCATHACRLHVRDQNYAFSYTLLICSAFSLSSSLVLPQRAYQQRGVAAAMQS